MSQQCSVHHLGRGKEQGEKGVTMAKRMLDCVTSDFVTFKKEDWLSSISGSEGRVIACESIGTVLTMTSIGTSQEGADTETIRQIALMCKMAGTDIHHLGDSGYTGMALPENILAYSKAIRGARHAYRRMAYSVNR